MFQLYFQELENIQRYLFRDVKYEFFNKKKVFTSVARFPTESIYEILNSDTRYLENMLSVRRTAITLYIIYLTLRILTQLNLEQIIFQINLSLIMV